MGQAVSRIALLESFAAYTGGACSRQCEPAAGPTPAPLLTAAEPAFRDHAAGSD